MQNHSPINFWGIIYCSHISTSLVNLKNQSQLTCLIILVRGTLTNSILLSHVFILQCFVAQKLIGGSYDDRRDVLFVIVARCTLLLRRYNAHVNRLDGYYCIYTRDMSILAMWLTSWMMACSVVMSNEDNEDCHSALVLWLISSQNINIIVFYPLFRSKS